MGLSELSVSLLLALSSFLGVHSYPESHPGWTITKAWVVANPDGGEKVSFEASSEELPRACRERPESYVRFPMVIHGAHEILGDGLVLEKTGDPSFAKVYTFYGAPVIRCAELKKVHVLTWRVVSYTRYFARVSFMPELAPYRPLHNVIAESLHVMGAGGAFVMALFSLTIFFGRVSNAMTLSVSCSCLGASMYFAATVAGLLGIPWSMLVAHKIADIGVWIGIALMMNSLRLEGALAMKPYYWYLANVVLGIIIIASGNTGDTIQFGTSLPFAASVVILFFPLVSAIRSHRGSHYDRRTVLQILSLLSFISACFNEMFVVSGLINTSPILPLGFLSGVLFFAFSVNERINETYKERDYLRANLEAEVERKTRELKRKTDELESAMTTLKSTQAELVQSAKLASLGTLSAGIAHEINNSLNYVNGALPPLEKLIVKVCPPEDRGKIDKLIAVMKDGLGLTLEIIKSLRNYTGLNQAKFNDVSVAQVAKSSLAIMRSKTRDRIEVETHIPEDLKIFGSVVGINQVFMNLISNAIDAMPEGGRLTIEAERASDSAPSSQVEIRIRDSGCGMDAKTAARIFDPFFTTKEVGKGTGLGLHIVRTEIDRHHGEIQVESEPGRGTCFRIRLPQDEAMFSEPKQDPSVKGPIEESSGRRFVA
jgi:signal transduction histidine kinase